MSKSSLDLKRHGGYRCADRKYPSQVGEEDLNSICEMLFSDLVLHLKLDFIVVYMEDRYLFLPSCFI